MISGTWEYWISHVDSIDNLTPNEKEKAKVALEYIKSLFGEELTDLINKNHPIVYYIAKNFAPWTRRWLISLIDAIKTFSNQKNSSKILNNIIDKDKFKEALLQLSVGKCIIDYGFAIEPLIEDNKTKTTDWKLTDLKTHEHILVEITEISNPPDWEKRAKRIFEQISERIFHNVLPRDNLPYLICSGRLFKEYISIPVLKELLKKIDYTAQMARTMGYAELVEENTISLAFATEEHRDLLKPWSIKQKVVDSEEFQDSAPSFKGSRYEVNEVNRILIRINEKKIQLDRSSLNILIIRDDRVFYSSYCKYAISRTWSAINIRYYCSCSCIKRESR